MLEINNEPKLFLLNSRMQHSLFMKTARVQATNDSLNTEIEIPVTAIDKDIIKYMIEEDGYTFYEKDGLPFAHVDINHSKEGSSIRHLLYNKKHMISDEVRRLYEVVKEDDRCNRTKSRVQLNWMKFPLCVKGIFEKNGFVVELDETCITVRWAKLLGSKRV